MEGGPKACWGTTVAAISCCPDAPICGAIAKSPPELSLGWRTAKFDLTLFMFETPTGLSGTFEYASDLFDRSTIERLSGQLRSVLEQDFRIVAKNSWLRITFENTDDVTGLPSFPDKWMQIDPAKLGGDYPGATVSA